MWDSNALMPIDDIDHLWIPMPDGTKLAARMWRPKNAMERPVPAIFEYIPYRKADMVRARDERNHPFLAQNGFACLRVDMRGSGDSEGHMPDMYDLLELSDAHAVINWLAAQTWCNGNVGMFGTSWGGTASLQANCEAPKALKAIIAVCATHNRYEDDIHHMGGCLIPDSVEWGATLPTILGSPPTCHMGDHWMDIWKDRLKGLAFPLVNWIKEEARGTYWRHGSVTHCSEKLTAPILNIGGWADRSSNSVMNLVDKRPDLCWGIVGPWGHHYPDHGNPGPAMGVQKVMLDWWRHWLKPEEKHEHQDVSQWPKLQVWLREFDPPQDYLETRNGDWMESGPASMVTAPHRLYLSPNGLHDQSADLNTELPSDLLCGQAGADTGYFGRVGGLPLDQNSDDERALIFETHRLEDDLILFGATELHLNINTQNTKGQVCVRMVDVAPDGQANRVTWQTRNLALNDDLDQALDVENVSSKQITISLPTMAYRFKKGHKLRISLSSSYWPMVWTPVSSEGIMVENGSLVLPILRGQPKPLSLSLPEAYDLPAPKSFAMVHHAPIERFYEKTNDGFIKSGWRQPSTALFFNETNTEFGYETRADYLIDPANPLSATCQFDHQMHFKRNDGHCVISCVVSVSADANNYHIEGHFQCDWNNDIIEEKQWDKSIPRQCF